MAIDPLTALLSVGDKLIDRLIPDKQKAAEARLKLQEMAHDEEMALLAAEIGLAEGQLAINKVEAAHSSVFVAGWRPFIGWICGVGLGANFILMPLGTWARDGFKDMPDIAIGDLLTLTMAMLGMAGLRTYEKFKEVDRDRIEKPPKAK